MAQIRNKSAYNLPGNNANAMKSSKLKSTNRHATFLSTPKYFP